MFNDLKDKQFGRLKVVEMVPRTQSKTFWKCVCECGNITTVRSDSLVGLKTTSCGCYKKEHDSVNLIKNHSHKQSGTRLYHTLFGIIARCYNPNSECYQRYGGRGIKVCDEWRYNPESFLNWANSNGYEKHLTIERVNNNGNYEPSNCKWATNKEQSNNRRSNIKIVINGESNSLKEWCNILGLNYGTIYSRYKRGVSIERLFVNEDLRTY